MSSWTEQIVDFTRSTTYADLSDDVLKQAVIHVIDHFSVALAGAREYSSEILRRAIGRAEGVSSVVGTSIKCSADLAALYNGFSAHALDFDDTQLSTSPDAVYGLLTHPTTPVLSATLAVAEELHADGKEALLAYVTGLEVACRIADAIDSSHYRRGFHSTGTIGTFGAAMAAAKLLELDAQQTKIALGIAGSMAAGLRESFGTMTKPFHAGRAAQSGVIAAHLAHQGFTAATNILEARRGFVQAAAGSLNEEKFLLMGKPFFFEHPGVSIKRYPSGSLSHPAQDLILKMMETYEWDPQLIDKIIVGSNSNVVNALLHNQPQTGLEAKFSIPFCMSIAVLRRRAGLKEFTTETVTSQDIQDFLPRITLMVDPQLEEQGYQHVRTRVHVHLKSGEVFSNEAEYAKGYPANPMSMDDIYEKFENCASVVLSDTRTKEAFQSLQGFATVTDVTELMKVFAI